MSLRAWLFSLALAVLSYMVIAVLGAYYHWRLPRYKHRLGVYNALLLLGIAWDGLCYWLSVANNPGPKPLTAIVWALLGKFGLSFSVWFFVLYTTGYRNGVNGLNDEETRQDIRRRIQYLKDRLLRMDGSSKDTE